MTLFQVDFFIFTLILLLVGGGICVVVAAFGLSRSNAVGFDVTNNVSDDADDAISEFGDMSKSVFKEFDNKYQELLFLYSLIDEKQKNITQAEPPNTAARFKGQASVLEEYAKRVDIAVDDSKKMNINPKFASILKMYKEGQTVEEIARKMDMGKGEVELIITLGGGQNG